MNYGSKNYLSGEGQSQSLGSGDYLSDSKKLETKTKGGGGMDPYSAAIMVAGTFLTQAMSAKQQEEEMKKQAAMQAVSTGLQQENVGNNTLMQAWAKGLGGMK